MRRSLAALPLTGVLLAGLVGCGDNSSEEASPAEPVPTVVDGVSVTGDFGEKPTIEVDGLDVDEPVDGVVIEGEGAEVTETTMLDYRFHMVYGSNGEEVASNYAEPAAQQMDFAEQAAAITDAVVGTTVGSRVVIALPVDDLVGEGGAEQFGLRADDDLIMVLDLVSESEEPLAGPDGEAVEAPADAPTVVESDGVVTGIDFSTAAPKPSGELQVIPLIEGSGDAISEGDSVTVDYYGAVYGEDKAFDESYSGEPASFTLAEGSLIDGWVTGLAGVKAGSRVMLIIPAEQGYGSEGTGGIPGGSTLVFVIDVLGVNL
ncbi:FKBP-type peptidyl-prolyl cis-trans isomerase [Nocardioides sp.]|uniref:FKBP-type peptidyl-prolyl cis-trans isomerase n=1 Tax=Nocardioides sp. TaxID=35761 RepID=UPI002D0AEE84|nr:FKBP-type peptidyl-prolyl cis-trans isomerase [Nocardioides sp.]HXH78119.1 FKBP-type peptidyl-prolyl cis-trans isomerase [Nocardioides sp.]